LKKHQLTFSAFLEPVTDLCAHNFDREAITSFLDNHHRCPISKKPLNSSDLRANHSLAEQIERWKFYKDHDGLVRETVEEDPTSALSEDEELDDTVIQMEQGTQRKTRQGKQHQKMYFYNEIPPEFMLLPQERQILASVRSKVAATRSMAQKQRCYRTTCTLIGFLVVCAGALITWKSFSGDDE
jgi:hypothetical protein